MRNDLLKTTILIKGVTITFFHYWEYPIKSRNEGYNSSDM